MREAERTEKLETGYLEQGQFVGDSEVLARGEEGGVHVGRDALGSTLVAFSELEVEILARLERDRDLLANSKVEVRRVGRGGRDGAVEHEALARAEVVRGHGARVESEVAEDTDGRGDGDNRLDVAWCEG